MRLQFPAEGWRQADSATSGPACSQTVSEKDEIATMMTTTNRTLMTRAASTLRTAVTAAALAATTIAVGGGVVSPAALAQANYGEPGDLTVGWTRVQVTRDSGARFDSRVYYPATGTTFDSPFDPSAGPYPVIVFGHGYLTDPAEYIGTYQHLASWGYIVMAPESALNLFPNHQKFADDLRDCMDYMEVANADPANRFFGGVDEDNMGLSGHSMGGGASILAAADETLPRLKGVANLAAADTRPSSIAAMERVNVPISLISGSEDSITPLEQHGLLMYQNGNAPRLLPVIQGGWHCGFLDRSNLVCDSGSISQQASLRLTREYLTSFFNLYLKGDEEAWPVVWGPSMILDPEVNTQADPGMTMLPRVQRQGGSASSEVVYTIRLTNTRDDAQGFEMFVDNARWTTTVVPAATNVLNPGDFVDLTVTVEVPTNVQPGAADIAVISARSTIDNLTRQVAATRTQATN